MQTSVEDSILALSVTAMKYQLISKARQGFRAVVYKYRQVLIDEAVELFIDLEHAKNIAIEDLTYDIPESLKQRFREIMAFSGDRLWLACVPLLIFFGHLELHRINEAELAGDEKEGCPICLVDQFDLGQLVVQMTCGHRFHWPCIFEWFGNKFSCPTCRREIE